MGDHERVVQALVDTWTSTIDLGRSLDDAEWDAPTGCPGWTVRDQFAHLVGTESMLLGRPAPPTDDDAFGDHVRNDVAKFNEAWVQARRDTPPKDVLAEFEEVTAERTERLRSMGDDEWTADAMTPVGPGRYEDFMRIRVFDCWVHEQDIRRAVGRPGHLEGPAVDLSLDMIAGSLGRTVGKKAAAPDGATVAIELTGPIERRVAVGVTNGRAALLDDVPDEPTATIALDGQTFVALACGRADATADGVTVTGDEALARRVADNLAFTF